MSRSRSRRPSKGAQVQAAKGAQAQAAQRPRFATPATTGPQFVAQFDGHGSG